MLTKLLQLLFPCLVQEEPVKKAAPIKKKKRGRPPKKKS